MFMTIPHFLLKHIAVCRTCNNSTFSIFEMLTFRFLEYVRLDESASYRAEQILYFSINLIVFQLDVRYKGVSCHDTVEIQLFVFCLMRKALFVSNEASGHQSACSRLDFRSKSASHLDHRYPFDVLMCVHPFDEAFLYRDR